MSEDTTSAATAAPAAEPAPTLSEAQFESLAARVLAAVDADRGAAPRMMAPTKPPKKPREPIFPVWVRKACTSTIGLWPLFVILAVLTFASVVAVSPQAIGYAFIDRLTRILMLATVALLWDIWTRPHSQPQDLVGPAQGAAEYRRIYTVGIFVIAGCLAP